MGNVDLGRQGEDAAVRYLEAGGYEVLERNWHCRFGEADIIALDEDGALVFIEVKTRRGIEAGIPEEAVTAEKRGRYERIAMCYLVAADWDEETSVRFDIIGICASSNGRAMLRHHRGCFDAEF